MGIEVDRNKAASEPVNIALVGCGAVSELSHAPALGLIEGMKLGRVTHLIDPSPARRQKLLQFFPNATAADSVSGADRVDLALVATPPGNHAETVEQLASRGIGMLCEKPIAVSQEHADRIVAATEGAGVFCSIGQFRRWFPAVGTIRSIIRAGSMGELLSVRGMEGGLFRWPVASGAIFNKAQSGGGITMDIGIHALDLLRLWLGELEVDEYADDAEGGVEINARATLSSPVCPKATLRMSWDWRLPNFYEFQFERARLRWPTTTGNRLLIRVEGSERWVDGNVHEEGASDWNPVGPVSATQAATFTQQWVDVIGAFRNGDPPPVPPSDAARSLALVLACYGAKKPMGRPWADVPGGVPAVP